MESCTLVLSHTRRADPYLHGEQVNRLRHLHQLMFGHLAGSVGVFQDPTQLLFLGRQQRTAPLQQDDLFSQLTEQVELLVQFQLVFLHLQGNKHWSLREAA